MLSNYNKTGFAFALIIILVIFIGIFSVHTVRTLSVETDRLYNHPFAVSNAARDIKINMVSMHRYMKDVVLAQNNVELETANTLVNQHEEKVFGNFRIIFDRFLGDKDIIHRVYQSFVLWREIRHEVMSLKRAGHSDEAALITKGKGADHVQLLTNQTDELVDFAAAKAFEFHLNSQENKDRSMIVMGVLATTACLVSFAIAIFILRGQKDSIAEIKKRSHLIDQNIMIANLNTDGEVKEITNALCRYLEILRPDILHTQSHFFLSDEEKGNLEMHIWHLLKTGLQWSGEIKKNRLDGGVKWAKMTILPNLNSHYEIDGYTCILQDMTSKKLSMTDNLTTLGNRRQYDEILDRELSLAKRHGTYLTLAILDIDFFKLFNDKYGHPQGDIALAKVGKAIVSCMRRPNDYTFRIGGEEFAVLFSATNREDSRLFLESIRHQVEILNIIHENSSVSDHMTISIGGTTVNGSSLESAELLYIDADKALYMAKEVRNQTVMA